ncbi:hypothetical protein [Gloeothece verrucosa]|uniref:Uncharacterized protein n=1 Tax=Gloeothece verrucosa (strain PCC 7822) TaxID=497965 RepID=E0U6B3_GLOV7|nr:hypothetical protein [Gloeothece verrucosa]ADN12449.1 hypothetical protein Cyan7822_0404 [Gloeothece verrucosa PCC 7822]
MTQQPKPDKVAKPGDTIIAWIFGGIILFTVLTGLILAGTF